MPTLEIHIVEDRESGWRLDVFLVHHFPQYSRTMIREAIMHGGVVINPGSDAPSHGKPAYRLESQQTVQFTLPDLPHKAPQPENIPLDILFEDEDLVVVNKPVDMVVHPSRGHWSGTLASALSFHFGNKLSTVRGTVRPGIIHRLDRDTTGVILVAKNDIIHAKLAALFEGRQIRKEYIALVFGCPPLDRDMIDVPISQHPKVREKMAVALPNDPNAKHAQTFYEVVQHFGRFALLRCLPKTGRTHQIRVHLAHKGYPILCDRMYGGRRQITQEELLGKQHLTLNEENTTGTVLLQRQALHAHKLTFTHPFTEKELEITAPIPPDMQRVIHCLENI